MKFFHRNSSSWNANMLADCSSEKGKSQGFGKGMSKLQRISIYHSQQDWFTGSSNRNFFVLNLKRVEEKSYISIQITVYSCVINDPLIFSHKKNQQNNPKKNSQVSLLNFPDKIKQ